MEQIYFTAKLGPDGVDVEIHDSAGRDVHVNRDPYADGSIRFGPFTNVEDVEALDAEKDEVEERVKDAEAEIDDLKADVAEGETKLDEACQAFNDVIASVREQIDMAGEYAAKGDAEATKTAWREAWALLKNPL